MSRAARFTADALGVPLGVALAVGALGAVLLEPRWRTGGLVYLLQYPKNVEITATLAALLAAGTTGVLIRRRALRLPLYAVAICGWTLAARHLVVVAGWPGHLAFLGLSTVALGRCEAEPCPPNLGPDTSRRGRWLPWLVVAALVVASGLAFLKTLTPTRQIDVFHHGEVLGSALNLLEGGRPFVDFVWPHGLHDTGLTALWVELTGKPALSSVTLAQATNAALAPITIFWIARGILRAPAAAALAVASVLVAPSGGGALVQLGRVPFAALALVLITSTRARPCCGRVFAAGVAAGLQHLFRIDAGLFAVVAVAAAASHLGWSETTDRRRRAVAAARSASIVVAGFATTMVASWVLVGWPGAAWWRWVLQVLPVYHGDANGLPMPWPVGWSQAAPQTFERYALPAVTGLALTAVLIATTMRLAAGRGSRDRRLTRWFVFVAVFAWQASRTVLGRSDAHVTTWTPILAVVVLCLAVRGAQAKLGQRAALVALVAIMLVVEPRTLSLAGLRDVGERVGASNWSAMVDGVPSWSEHVQPNPRDSCGSRLFTATEMTLERNRRLAEGSCAVDAILRSEGAQRVLYVNSAPWYQVRFGTTSPTRFYTLLRPYTPDLQASVVASLRRDGLDAVLYAQGYGAISRYNNVHDGLHAPLITAYLMERLRDVEVRETPLGELHLPHSATAVEERIAAPGPGPLDVNVEWMVFDEQSGFLWARGSAIDARRPQPLDQIELRCPEPCGAVALGLPGTELGEAIGEPEAMPAAWELAVFLPPGVQPTLRLVPNVGPARDVPIDIADATLLPGRSGSEWDGLRDRVQQMVRLGRADRMLAVSPAGVSD